MDPSEHCHSRPDRTSPDYTPLLRSGAKEEIGKDTEEGEDETDG